MELFFSRSTVVVAPSQFFVNEIFGFETSSRVDILRYGAPCSPDATVR